jgi:hypothetical protein
MSRTYGRKVNHDPRSLAYSVGPLPKGAIKSIRWTRRAPVFDQGQVGSCTGNAAAGLIGTDSLGRTGATSILVTTAQADATRGVFTAGTHTVDEDLAVLCYELNTRLDSFAGTYKPTDTGSDGVSAAKTLKALGQADTYSHVFTMASLDAALQSGPVMAGTQWMASMEDPAADGTLTVDRTGEVLGGHEYVIDELDVERSRYGITNSWGTGWGIQGRAYISKADMQWLLSKQGDVTVPHFNAPQPAPVPVPVPAVTDADVLAAYRSLQAWAKRQGIVVTA